MDDPTASGDGARHLQLIVQDDGCGFDPATAPGFGIRGMQERVQGLGGRYMVESGHGSGTRVRIVIPLRGTQEHRDVPMVEEPQLEQGRVVQ